MTLSWSASTDNVGVRIYEVLRDGTVVASTLGLNYTDVGLEAGTSYTYSIIARDEANNASPAATLTIPTPANGNVVLRINGGGPAFVDAKGNTWAADSGFNTGPVPTNTNAIDRAVDDTLFKTDRIDSATALPDLAYAFTLANGDYEVQLFLAELNTASSAVGKRVFDVVIENQLAFDNLDVFALAGAPFTAVVVSTTTSVTDGQLNLAFVRGIGNPKANAIKVIRLPAAETFPPTTPANFKATATTSTSVTLAWYAATDNVGVTGYEVARDGTVLTTLTEFTFTDTALAPSTSYAYAVVAIDAAGNRSVSSAATVATTAVPDIQAPSPPGTLTFGSVTATGGTVSWTAATDNVGVTGYEVYRDAVLLTMVTGLTFSDTALAGSTAYVYSVVAVDGALNGSTATSATVTTAPTTVIRVNAGGTSYVDPAGQTWLADTGYNGGTTATTTVTVAGTTNPTLYKSERYRTPSTIPLTYTFSVPNGNYLVRLHFAETYSLSKGAGKRVFDIDVQGTRAFDNVDIFVMAGGGNRALVLEKPTTVTNGQIRLSLYQQVQNPKINGLEIISGP